MNFDDKFSIFLTVSLTCDIKLVKNPDCLPCEALIFFSNILQTENYKEWQEERNYLTLKILYLKINDLLVSTLGQTTC